MDRAEKIGLGSAVGGHALLFALLTFGLLNARNQYMPPDPISVSLVGEIAAVSSAPDAIQEEPAPAAPAAAEQQAEPPPPTPEIMKIEQAVAKPKPAPLVKPATTKPAAKVAVAPKPVAKPAFTKSTTAQAAKPAATAKSSGFSRSFEDTVAGAGKTSGQGKAVGTPAAKSATEIRRTVNATLAGQIKPYLEACAPSGVDIDALRTFITLSLDSTGRLNAVRFDKQTGVNASNSPQAVPLQQCALKAARQASPYRGLDPEYYDIWKNHALQLKAR